MSQAPLSAASYADALKTLSDATQRLVVLEQDETRLAGEMDVTQRCLEAVRKEKLLIAQRLDPILGKAPVPCCSRDHGMDGDCDRHSAPGVSRTDQPAPKTAVLSLRNQAVAFLESNPDRSFSLRAVAAAVARSHGVDPQSEAGVRIYKTIESGMRREVASQDARIHKPKLGFYRFGARPPKRVHQMLGIAAFVVREFKANPGKEFSVHGLIDAAIQTLGLAHLPRKQIRANVSNGIIQANPRRTGFGLYVWDAPTPEQPAVSDSSSQGSGPDRSWCRPFDNGMPWPR